ncbi:ubiquitin carboxyl-terminal hydrolase 32-like isoform X1 [Myxocyprinus asiaticus]|uniref:ubiquitin carboxyl-terminal hydrolase 32-like isoform X1 n=1 Tax=Myxocyprinus asiaticus TaxID=70543 RepID=UPI002221677F|nr:ubiquitin carboxyl-terminal hydrolase 32-like isoform X1 [Myxocyprinus asiaticus]
MGAKESRIGFLSYDEAVKRVTDVELKRLRDAFKRTSGLSVYMTQQCFYKEVLGDGVPPKVAEVIYNSFGGTSKGLHFNYLIVGLVLLTRGRDEEKAKYIFSLFASDSGTYIVRDDVENMLRSVDGEVPPSLRKCFTEGEKVNYDKFKSWLLQNKEAFTFSRWLLSGGVCVTLTDDSDTPTFYQTLAGVTHLEESDIIDLEKRYWLLKAQSRTGRFDLETFVPLVSPPIHASLSEGLFHAFDENRDNHIDFKEISCGLSACCRGPVAERQKFCFKVFDVDRDGVLSRDEIHEMVVALLEVWKDNRTDTLPEFDSSVSDIVEDILKMHDTTKQGHLTLEDYQIWSVKSALANEFLNLLFQVCHIVLGLRPATPEEEGQIIRGWLERESRHGLQPSQNWFLISRQWWQQWKDYVRYDNNSIVVEQPSMQGSGLRSPQSTASVESFLNRVGTVARSPSSQEEKFPDNMSSSSEASETTGNSLTPHISSSATDVCFARQYNISDNNNQCFSSANGHLPSSMAAQRPGAIDNQPLVTTEPMKAPTLTMEGGRLKKSQQLIAGRDFETVPEPVWRALYHWYGANLSLPRPVIMSTLKRQPELELFPRYLLFLRQQPATRTPQSNIWVNMGMTSLRMFPPNMPRGNVPSPNAPLKRVLAYTGCFSRMGTIKDIHEYLSQRLRIKEEDMRLWLYNSENYLTLLDDEDHTLESLKIQDEQHLIIEVRNKDMSWPEEMSFIANSSKIDRHKVPTEQGATGLSNLGNTCFMNSSIQCVSNTKPLTEYFISGRHLYELNRTNPIGMRGHMAKCYGDLIQELWSGTQKNVAPLKLRWTIAKYAPRFNGFQQQDSQELLAFLLDGLHEDLNRVHEKPYVELKDSDGRPDLEVATEAWENHLRRNRSIVVDLFHGQLRSQVKCKTCGHISARFDPFNFLSLPLPMDSSMHLEITVIKLDGSTPVRYGLRLNMDEKYMGLKKQLSELCSLKPEQILLAEVLTSNIKNFPQDNQKVRHSANGFLCAFEIPVPGSPTSVTSPVQTESAPMANGTAGNNHIGKSGLIPNGMPSTVVPCAPEKPLINGIPNGHTVPVQDSPFIGYIIAMHRKMMRMELYFLSSQKNRPSLFGMPLIVPCTVHTSKKDLYDAVWIQVSRLASPLPPQEASNHAQDCDDSMGYQYPFTLRVVQKDGNSCAWCPWYRFCRGCTVECNDDRASLGNAYIAVDWDPTALHLRYQTSQERIVEEHPSVEQSRRAQAEPISLDSCLKAFTSEEELGEDELYYCSKCKTHRLATKKLDLWRLPPILIVHLKRFQFVNGRWIKSQKIVKFPRESFDPSAFLAPREVAQSMGSLQSQSECLVEELQKLESGDSSVSSVSTTTVASPPTSGKGTPCSIRRVVSPLSRNSSPSSSPRNTGRKQGRLRLPQLGSRHRLSNSKENLDSSITCSSKEGETEPEQGIVTDGENQGTVMLSDANTQDSWSLDASSTDCDVIMVNGLGQDSSQSNGHTEVSAELDTPHQRDDICLEPLYNLYAISCHSGIMGGGHYVTYAKNPNEKWYCYNDSSCKEVHSDEIDTDSAYILFYEQQGVDYSQFLPKTEGKKMADTTSMDEDFESDYKKYCVLQ